MRHESIETAMRFYVGQNAKATADECWRVVESEEKNGVADLDFKWTEAGSNRRHMDFQSIALPTELPVPVAQAPAKRRILRSGREDVNDRPRIVVKTFSALRFRSA